MKNDDACLHNLADVEHLAHNGNEHDAALDIWRVTWNWISRTATRRGIKGP